MTAPARNDRSERGPVGIPLGVHVAVVDLGFGDAGKGTVVDWLCAAAAGAGRPVQAVIRFNGGAQAGHNVVLPATPGMAGREHTFAQFGAGTLRGVPTYLSRHVIFDPLALTAEAEHLEALGVPHPYGLLTVDPEALVATPYHRLANQARERARGEARHGSCGMGVGETVAYALANPDDAVRVADLTAPATLRRKLDRLARYLHDTVGTVALDAVGPELLAGGGVPVVQDLVDVYRLVAERVHLAGGDHLASLLRAGACVFEGAQGVLLDEWRGFHPHTTWSTTTFDNVDELRGDSDVYRLGVLRTYTARHGAGPLPTEDATLTALLANPHNRTGQWQGPFRVGHFDAVAHRYAAEVAGGVDGVALTHVDAALVYGSLLRVCTAYTVGGAQVGGAQVGGEIGRIEPGPYRDLAHQQALTAVLASAVPVLDPDPISDWPTVVKLVTGAPVVVRSFGPTAEDKRGWG